MKSNFFRMLSRRFPYAVYYQMEGSLVKVFAIMDNRSDPAWNKLKLLDSLKCYPHHYWPNYMLSNLTQEELAHPEVEPLLSYVKQKL